MRTRAEIYGCEAAELLRIISMYPGLSEKQLCRFYPGKGEAIKSLLSHLCRQGRTLLSDSGNYFPYRETGNETDTGMARAAWVLLDFIDRVEYHSSSDFPVKIVFFSHGELYEIVHAAAGQETLINHALHKNPGNGSRRIALVDSPGQIPLLEFPGITGFCTVDDAGNISYYKKST
ncbi:MAG: DUF5697 family protein [Lachnospiraceae bacterium]|nr:DUF5697 family protein [Lachnospiraceae bacterium]MCM1239002.1 DUF5697 family protein [Lachnospiraceae bacterium]